MESRHNTKDAMRESTKDLLGLCGTLTQEMFS